MSFLSEARVKSIVKMKSVANLRKIRLISQTHQSVSYTWVETEALNWINTRFKANLSRLSRFFSHDRGERSWQAPSRSLKHDNVAIWLIAWANNGFMNALALHLNNAFYCARKKKPRHDMNSRNPLIAGITPLDTFRDNLRVSPVPALNAPQKTLEWWKHLWNGLFDSRRRRQSWMTQFSYCVSSQNKPQTVLRFIVPKQPRKSEKRAMYDVISGEWLH